MTTKQMLRRLSLVGAGVKRWLLLILIGGAVITLGIVTLDWSVGEHKMIDWMLQLFDRIYNNTVLPSWFLSVVGWLLVFLGVGIAVVGAYQSMVSMLRIILTAPAQRAAKTNGPKVVVLGGGTGIHPVLIALKFIGASVSVIVTVADSGGSTGRLREEFMMLAPGDIRQCLLALSDQPLLDKIMRYRFQGNTSLSGHSMGNLMLAVLTETEGDFAEAVYRLSRLLAAKGSVVPFTIDDVSLCAKFEDGTVVSGEANIPKANKRIKNVFFNPPYAKPYVRVLEAISDADYIIVGPGSLYTSIMPTLLLAPIVDTIAHSHAKKIFMCNIMTEPGETDGFTISDHLGAIKKHTGVDLFDTIVANTAKVPEEVEKRYSQVGSCQIFVSESELGFLPNLIAEDLITVEGSLVRHSENKLARTFSRLIRGK